MPSFGRLPGFCILLLAVTGAAVGFQKGEDFHIFHYGIQMAARHPEGVYSPLDKPIYFLYGPLFLALAWPLSFFGFAVNKALWLGFQLVAYFAFFAALARLFPRVFSQPLVWLWGFIFVINPIHSGFQWLNIQVPLLAVLLWAQFGAESADRRVQWMCSALVAWGVLIKVYPAFVGAFLYLTAGRAMRQGLWGGLLVGALLPFAVFGGEGGATLYRGFFENLTRLDTVDYLHAPTHIMNLHSLVFRMAHAVGEAQIAPRLSKVLTLAIAAGFFLLAGRASRRAAWKESEASHGWFVLGLALTVFLAPYTFMHYFIFYAPAFFWLLDRLAAGKLPRGAVAALGMVTLLVCFTTDFIVGRDWNFQLELYSAPLCGAMLLMFVVCWLLWRDRVILKRRGHL